MSTKKAASGSIFQSLRENLSYDLLSGFLVSLIALPLSLGIASASGFPPLMGVLTAIIGGIVIAFFAGSELTIKGPAAGLIVIVAGAVEELGNGNAELGWHLALGVGVVAALLQVLAGQFKAAKIADFFPIAAVHGLLASIGIIIISKQIHLLLGIAPSMLKDAHTGKGLEPLELLEMIPHSLANLTPSIAAVGVICLVVLFGLPMVKSGLFRKIPPALIALVLAIPLGIVFHLAPDMKDLAGKDLKPMVHVESILDHLGVQVSFAAATNPSMLPSFIKYVVMFFLVGSLETVISAKAIDLLDPNKGKSDHSKDLRAVGIGNTISAILGGLPMISEIARSSANLGNGAKSRWANFFHGVFLLIYVLALYQVINMVPVAALSAMLVFVGYRLASPKEFVHMWHLGIEQFIIFFTTIVVTLSTDLLVGISAGIIVNLIFHLVNGAPFGSLFKSGITVSEPNSNTIVIEVKNAALFVHNVTTNGILNNLESGKNVLVLLGETKLVDHSYLDNLHRFVDDYENEGGKVAIVGLDHHKKLSSHPLAARVNPDISLELLTIS
ncbi:MAG: SulP family inorganic anion transporter [Bacteroidia bacterium]|nr:SulP family inorganic anion transporter [Bacteroidia bacterium]